MTPSQNQKQAQRRFSKHKEIVERQWENMPNEPEPNNCMVSGLINLFYKRNFDFKKENFFKEYLGKPGGWLHRRKQCKKWNLKLSYLPYYHLDITSDDYDELCVVNKYEDWFCEEHKKNRMSKSRALKEYSKKQKL